MGGDGGVGNEAQRARREEEQRQARIAEGTQRTRKQFETAFNDKYYAGLRDSVKAAYQPDVDKQFTEAHQAMQAALRRAGLGQSSVAAQREGQAAKSKANADADVIKRMFGAQQDRQRQVAGAENDVLGQLNATADQQSAFANASSQIQTNTLYPVTPPLGQVFTDLTAGLGTQADLERYSQNRYNVFGRIPGWNERNRYTTNVKG